MSDEIVRSLGWNGESWQETQGARRGLAEDEIGVQIHISLIPPGRHEDALWVGKVADDGAGWVVGWGGITDWMPYRRDAASPVAGDLGSLEAALLVPARAIDAAVRELAASRVASVVGEGPLAVLATRILNERAISTVPANASRQVDLLVDTTGDPSEWERALLRLRGEGTVLLLIPPWAKPVDFNFYPEIHRRSLEVVARRWHILATPSASADRESTLRRLVAEAANSALVQPLALGTSDSPSDSWLAFRWI